MSETQSILGLADFHMWATFAVICMAIFLFTTDKIATELVSIGVVVVLLVLFHVFPFSNSEGKNLLGPVALLKGFANPVLFAILSLLVIGQGLFHTGAVERPAQLIALLSRSGPQFAFAVTFLVAGLISAFLNNTPVVVIFIPIVSAIATQLGQCQSRVLMPLSFITILGGMTTLIGSSANLIAASLAEGSGVKTIGFFDFAVPGILLASIGALYVIFILPRLLRSRASMTQRMARDSGKQFIAQITITSSHPWLGLHATAGFFPDLKDMTIRFIRRGGQTILPPFEDVTLEIGDVVVLAATRKVLTDALTAFKTTLPLSSTDSADDSHPSSVTDDIPPKEQLSMVETVVAPGSRLVGRTIAQAALRTETNCILLGIQRHSRMLRIALADIRLEAGDVLLMLGTRKAIRKLRAHRDLLLLEWSASELPITHHANRALSIFGLTIFAAATGLLPITIAALAGAVAMVSLGCLNVRQASRAIDRRIFLLIGSAFAMAEPLRITGGAEFIAHTVVDTFISFGPPVLLSAFFLLTAILTNFLSNHATAALLAPVAVSTAQQIGVDPAPFVYGFIFALNCSFATPIAYQTNLIVMGPGHYRFSDFVKGGIPLILILWLVYSIFAPFYYGL